jgi:Ni/Fe-hydrogenase 1 B-type cytochrome subunit
MDQSTASVNSTGSPFIQPHSAIIRIWHWLTFTLIALSIVTVILNLTLLNPRNNAQPVQNQLKNQGITISDRQAFSIAHHFDDQLWDLHKWIGFGISILLLFRVVAEFFIPRDQRIRKRMSNAIKIFKETEGDKSEYRHYLALKLTYTLFYILLILMSITGLSLAFGRQIAFLGQARRTIREIHAAGQWAMYAYVLVHIGGVIIADLGKAKGVVSGMINGNIK